MPSVARCPGTRFLRSSSDGWLLSKESVKQSKSLDEIKKKVHHITLLIPLPNCAVWERHLARTFHASSACGITQEMNSAVFGGGLAGW